MAASALSIEDYLLLDEILKSIGYSDIKRAQKSKDMFRLDLEAPRKLEGSEEGKRYSNNGYTSIIWTSFLLKQGKFRDTEKDIGWPIITMEDELVYSATPVPRTSGFVMKMARYAWINKWKIDNLPLCPCKNCKARMYIYRKRNTRQYMYICKNGARHGDGKARFRPWDYGLPPKAQQFLDLNRLAREAYRKRNEKKGIKPVPKAVTRKRWIVHAPHNIIKRTPK